MDTTNNTHTINKISSLKLPQNSDTAAAAAATSSSSSFVAADHKVKRYTSLRDLTVDVDSGEGVNGNGGYTMKNRLLNRAASAYLQCSPVLADGSREMASFRRRINRNATVLCLCWRDYVRDPIMACFRPIFTLLFTRRLVI